MLPFSSFNVGILPSDLLYIPSSTISLAGVPFAFEWVDEQLTKAKKTKGVSRYFIFINLGSIKIEKLSLWHESAPHSIATSRFSLA